MKKYVISRAIEQLEAKKKKEATPPPPLSWIKTETQKQQSSE